jgi:hypothetical protein
MDTGFSPSRHPAWPLYLRLIRRIHRAGNGIPAAPEQVQTALTVYIKQAPGCYSPRSLLCMPSPAQPGLMLELTKE